MGLEGGRAETAFQAVMSLLTADHNQKKKKKDTISSLSSFSLADPSPLVNVAKRHICI